MLCRKECGGASVAHTWVVARAYYSIADIMPRHSAASVTAETTNRQPYQLPDRGDDVEAADAPMRTTCMQ